MSPDSLRLEGMIAATFTPMHCDGSLNLDMIPRMVETLIDQGLSGLYVLGSTGEGVSLTFEERCEVAAKFVEAAARKLPVIVQCGSESLRQARQLAAHAEEIGADGISAVSPIYFKPESLETLIASMAEIASGAPKLPFYYYHIPGVTGLPFSMLEFLESASRQIPTLRGIKFTSTAVHEFHACLSEYGDRFEILWGVDEMLLSGLMAGGRAAVGSTYNFAAPVSKLIFEEVASGNLEQARKAQARSQEIVRTFVPYGPRAAQKAMMAMIGLDCGPCRLPITPLSESRLKSLEEDLWNIGFFE